MATGKCRNCTYYTAYYRKYIDFYSRLRHGTCVKHQKVLNERESCEDFKNNEAREKSCEKDLFKSLEKALVSIEQIAMILKEKKDEKEENN